MSQGNTDVKGFGSFTVDFDPFARGEVQLTVPTTEPQKEIWLSVKLGGDEANCAYNESVILTLHGPMKVDIMEQALREVVNRHEALRGTVSPDGNTFCIARDIRLEIPCFDMSGLREDAKKSKVDALLKKEVITPFDLEHGPLFRAAILIMAEDQYCVIFTGHHIIMDGWSTSVIIKELDAIYAAYSNGREISLGEPVQFSNYVRFINSEEQRAQRDKAERFWVDQFRGDDPVLDLPTTYRRPRLRTFQAAVQVLEIEKSLVSDLTKMGAQARCSLTVTMMAGLKILLHRLSGQNDIVVGLPAAGQACAGMERLIGHCVNILPIKSRINSDMEVFDCLKELQSFMLDAFEHQDFTFGSLLQKLDLQRDPGRVPLVPILFNIDSGISSLCIGEIKTSLKTNLREFENFEWFINGTNSDGKVIIECHYNSNLFNHETMRWRLSEFKTVLSEMVKNPRAQIKTLNILPADEYERHVYHLNNTSVEYPKNKCIHALFKEMAQVQKKKTAVTFENEMITYGELDRRSDGLAVHLKRMGVGNGSFTGILMNRSIEMAIALLGVLKAGSAYVPLDPDYPAERLRYMIEDAGIGLLLTQRELDIPPGKNDIPIVYLDSLLQDNAVQSICDVEKEASMDPENPAYIIYTSGSTGKPKGVVVTHRAMVNFLLSTAKKPGINRDDVLLALTTLSFDIAGLELFLPLLSGAKVCVVKRETAADATELITALQESKATIMQATPSTWRMILDAGWEGSARLKVLCGGEPFPHDLAGQLVSKCKEVWNMYGPTETTIWSTCYRVVNPEDKILIGRPIENTRCYVLDTNMHPSPIGVPGELYISGDGVAIGYHNKPEDTARAFLPSPFVQGEVIYKTGDRVSLLADGNIEYLDRIDTQVKVRGYRIELGEIESRLKEHESVKQAVAIVKALAPGNVRLAAYIIPANKHEVIGTELRRHLRNYLPDYMLPQHFIEEHEFPLTPAGKIDRKKLENQFSIGVRSDDAIIAPSSESEIYLAGVWQEILSVNVISTHHNFFNIGGHSLLSMKVISKVLRDTGIRINPRDMLLNTLGQIAYQYEFKNKKSKQEKHNDENATNSSFYSRLKNKWEHSLDNALIKGKIQTNQ